MTLSLTNLEEEVERKLYLGTPSLLYLVAKGDFWTIRVGILLTHMILAQQCICMLDMSTVQTDACKGYTRKNSGSGTKLYTELKTEQPHLVKVDGMSELQPSVILLSKWQGCEGPPHSFPNNLPRTISGTLGHRRGHCWALDRTGPWSSVQCFACSTCYLHARRQITQVTQSIILLFYNPAI